MLLSGEGPRGGDMPREVCTIEVRGFKATTTDDTIQSFFENKRKSGGDDIKHFKRDEENNVIHITYCDPAGQF
jgi:hypothetical protein